MINNQINQDTICALASPQGVGAIAVIRLSGKDAIVIADKIFQSTHGKKELKKLKSHTIHFGFIKDGNTTIDEVLVSIFKSPNSYTGENIVEISCHGSVYIQQQILQLLIRNSARPAKAGEFTLRAFLNHKLDLSQAEAVADLISSGSAAAHKVAMQQMRGGFSKEIKNLRNQLIHFASLIELELDFAEEDVEFANREKLNNLISSLISHLSSLTNSFAIGNVIKNGIPVAIVGKPNAGKSTLLNILLNEERAIVSEIAGTTRDTIEEELIIDGINFRFIDTAGIRETQDSIENIGVSRTFEKINQSTVVIYLFDVNEITSGELKEIEKSILQKTDKNFSTLLFVGNKIDKADIHSLEKEFLSFENIIFISAKENINLEKLKKSLLNFVNENKIGESDVIVTNVRHYEALQKSNEALTNVLKALSENIAGDFLAVDIRKALHHLGEITGEISTDDLLENIFKNFCIGK